MKRTSPALRLAGAVGCLLADVQAATAAAVLAPPSNAHWLGTDALGRDVLARTWEASSYTLGQTVTILVASIAIGVVLGAVSARYFDGSVDRLMVLTAEALRSFPTLVLVLLFASVGLPVAALLILYFWVPVWRVVRSALVSQQRQPYAITARLIGMRPFRVLVTEVTPNIMAGLSPYAASLLAEILAAQAAIEFLGFGPPIDQPSLGGMLLYAVQLGFVAPWVWVPSLVVVVAAVALAAVLTRLVRRLDRSTRLG